MLYNVPLGAIFEQPARECPLPFIGAVIEHDELNESAGFLRPFPLRGAFAGTQADECAANADAFAGLQRDITHQPVALVEQADHRDAFRHRRRACVNVILAFGRLRARQRLVGLRRCGLSALGIATSGQRHDQRHSRRPKQGVTRGHTQASGVHA